MNKSASLKINDDLNLSFLPEMDQDWIELFLKFLVFKTEKRIKFEKMKLLSQRWTY